MFLDTERLSIFAVLLTVLSPRAQAADYDVILRGGTVYDGSGNPPVVTDVAIQGDRIAAIGDLAKNTAKQDIDVNGMAVAPGFINMLSWAEENVRKQIKLPWVTFCSDAESSAPEGAFLKASAHPRAYGNFARLLGRYVRDEKLIPLEEAVRRLTTLPAENVRIKQRGALKPGYFADVIVFDPEKIQDHATFEKPLQYSTGMIHVFVNGQQVLNDGEHTGAKPGRVVHGPRKKSR